MEVAVYYSPSTRGFYHSPVHGHRRHLTPDPAWTPPEGAEEGASAPLIEADNPHCLVPIDAVEITEAHHHDLMTAQSTGKMIDHGEDGVPFAKDRPPAPIEVQRERVKHRCSVLLGESAWSQAPDAPEAIRAAWAPYRSALWSILGGIDANEAPAAVQWPNAPT